MSYPGPSAGGATPSDTVHPNKEEDQFGNGPGPSKSISAADGASVAAPNWLPMRKLHAVPGTSAQHALRDSTRNDVLYTRNFDLLRDSVAELKLNTEFLMHTVTALENMNNELQNQMRIRDIQMNTLYQNLKKDVNSVHLGVHHIASEQLEIKDFIAQLVAMTKDIDRQVQGGDSGIGVMSNNSISTSPVPAPVREKITAEAPISRALNRGRPPLPPTSHTWTPRRRYNTLNEYRQRRWSQSSATPSRSSHIREISSAVPPPKLEPLQQCEQSLVLPSRPVRPPQQSVTHENAILQNRSKILQLAARFITICLLLSDHKCRTNDTSAWLFQESVKCMDCAAFEMSRYPNYEYAKRSLYKGLSFDDYSMEWFVAGPSPENLKLARRNYNVRDAPPSDAEWIMEEKLLTKLAECFKRGMNEYPIEISEGTLSACIAVTKFAAKSFVQSDVAAYGNSQQVNSGSVNNDVAAVSYERHRGMHAPSRERRSIVSTIGASAQHPAPCTQDQSPDREDGDATQVGLPEARAAAAQVGSLHHGS